MNYPRSELLADDVRLRRNRPLLLLGIVGLVLCVAGGWLMATAAPSAEPEVESETTEL